MEHYIMLKGSSSLGILLVVPALDTWNYHSQAEFSVGLGDIEHSCECYGQWDSLPRMESEADYLCRVEELQIYVQDHDYTGY